MNGIIASIYPSVDEFPSSAVTLSISSGHTVGNIAVIREALKQSQQSIMGGKNA